MILKKNIAISDNGFIFNPSNGESFSVNSLGLEIIKKIQASKTNEDLLKEIINKYDIDKSTLEKDYYDFINMLQNYNILE
jgi:hypothetical protein